MKIKKRIHNSLGKTIAIYFGAYSLILFLVYMLFNCWINYNLNTAFPILEDFLEYEKLLEKEEYEKIPERKFRDVNYLIFDETGKVVYANDSKLKEQISADDLLIINDYYDDAYFEVAEKVDESGASQIYIFKFSHSETQDAVQVLDYCILDQELKIIEGSLFADHEDRLTERDLKLLNGIYHNRNITKYKYRTNENQARTLVFLSPIIDYESYNETIQIVSLRWLLIAPVVLFTIFLLAALFQRKIVKSVKLLENAIHSYQENTKVDIGKEKLPQEFTGVIDNFSNLIYKLEKTQEEKQKAYYDKQLIVADLSHDLKTPLTVILGYSNAFLQGLVVEEKKEKYMRAIRNKAQTASDLLDTLLTYTKMERNDFRMNVESVDLCEFLKDVLAEQYIQIEEKKFQLSVDIPEEKIGCSIDKVLMRRALENLIGNALKYNTEGTTLSITLKNTENEIIIIIADDGIGIEPSIQKSVFEPFVTSNTARATGAGNGLGLSIVKRIIELHNGKITLENRVELGEKTVFRITLPKNRW